MRCNSFQLIFVGFLREYYITLHRLAVLAARRATTGLSLVGGIGDIFIAFATGNPIGQTARISNVKMLLPRNALICNSGGAKAGTPQGDRLDATTPPAAPSSVATPNPAP